MKRVVLSVLICPTTNSPAFCKEVNKWALKNVATTEIIFGTDSDGFDLAFLIIGYVVSRSSESAVIVDFCKNDVELDLRQQNFSLPLHGPIVSVDGEKVALWEVVALASIQEVRKTSFKKEGFGRVILKIKDPELYKTLKFRIEKERKKCKPKESA